MSHLQWLDCHETSSTPKAGPETIILLLQHKSHLDSPFFPDEQWSPFLFFLDLVIYDNAAFLIFGRWK